MSSFREYLTCLAGREHSDFDPETQSPSTSNSFGIAQKSTQWPIRTRHGRLGHQRCTIRVLTKHKYEVYLLMISSPPAHRSPYLETQAFSLLSESSFRVVHASSSRTDSYIVGSAMISKSNMSPRIASNQLWMLLHSLARYKYGSNNQIVLLQSDCIVCRKI
jgi:hypothetical protein